MLIFQFFANIKKTADLFTKNTGFRSPTSYKLTQNTVLITISLFHSQALRACFRRPNLPIQLFCFKGTVIERGNPFTFFLQFKWPSNLNKLPFYIPVESFTGKKFHKIASSIAAAYFIQLSLNQLENILLKELLKYGYSEAVHHQLKCLICQRKSNFSCQLPTVEKKNQLL